MLSAKKKALSAALTQDVVALQNMEMEFFYQNFASINTMSAVIGGFAFSGLVIGTSYTGFFADVNEGSEYVVVQAFYACAALSISFCMLTCIVCTALNVRGPGLALRGPEGSLKRAVDLMRAYQRHVNTTLCLGLVFFHLTAMTYSWLMLKGLLTTTVVTIILTVFLVQMFCYVRSIVSDFRIKDQSLVEGGLGVDSLMSVAKDTGVTYQQGSQNQYESFQDLEESQESGSPSGRGPPRPSSAAAAAAKKKKKKSSSSYSGDPAAKPMLDDDDDDADDDHARGGQRHAQQDEAKGTEGVRRSSSTDAGGVRSVLNMFPSLFE